MARGNFKVERSHFRCIGRFRPLGRRFALWLGEGGRLPEWELLR